MEYKQHTHPDNLERYAFLWSEARLIIAALALFIGGYPPVLYFLPISGLYGIVSIFLKLSWIVSGVAAVYLVYRWLGNGQMLFGHKDTKDMVAFLVMVISGVNLGLVGLIGQNVGMTILSSYALFVIVAIAYLVSAYHLYTRWKASHERLF